ncbi:hypothetical protein EYF80_013612 [Liparis tanakae]|uniref:Uncharacterized protein n=1 Tax=Liparis tanakae TaxID=230148 RepID=A0A4Z2IE91_9TELE|nr:hypothetical protein EYF80_013612 [Liparis tanakae]
MKGKQHVAACLGADEALRWDRFPVNTNFKWEAEDLTLLSPAPQKKPPQQTQRKKPARSPSGAESN